MKGGFDKKKEWKDFPRVVNSLPNWQGRRWKLFGVPLWNRYSFPTVNQLISLRDVLSDSRDVEVV